MFVASRSAIFSLFFFKDESHFNGNRVGNVNETKENVLIRHCMLFVFRKGIVQQKQLWFLYSFIILKGVSTLRSSDYDDGDSSCSPTLGLTFIQVFATKWNKFGIRMKLNFHFYYYDFYNFVNTKNWKILDSYVNLFGPPFARIWLQIPIQTCERLKI